MDAAEETLDYLAANVGKLKNTHQKLRKVRVFLTRSNKVVTLHCKAMRVGDEEEVEGTRGRCHGWPIVHT